MSRNSNRVGAPPQPESASTDQLITNSESNDFSFIVPTEFVELPSGGAYYASAHPLHGEDTIEIKQMTAKEEDMLTSRTLLKKGVALDRVIQSLIVNKSIDPNSLLVGDKNALIIAARISAYGNEYTTKVTCPACGTVQEYTFDLARVESTPAESDSAYISTDNTDGTFNTILPKTNLEVTFRLLTGADEKRLLRGIEDDRKNKNVHERGITRQLVNMIVAVNGNTTREAISYLVENIPSIDARHLRTAYKAASPNIDLSQHFECGNCDYENTLEVPLSADFFWPNS